MEKEWSSMEHESRVGFSFLAFRDARAEQPLGSRERVGAARERGAAFPARPEADRFSRDRAVLAFRAFLDVDLVHLDLLGSIPDKSSIPCSPPACSTYLFCSTCHLLPPLRYDKIMQRDIKLCSIGEDDFVT